MSVVVGIEVRLNSILVDKWGKQLPPQAEVDGDPIIELPFVLRIDAGLQTTRVVPRASDREISCIRRSDKEVPKRASSEDPLIEGEQTIVVRRGFNLRHCETYPAEIDAATNRVSTPSVGEVICELLGRRQCRANVVSADRGEVGAVAEDDGRKALIRWMIRYIHALIAPDLYA